MTSTGQKNGITPLFCVTQVAGILLCIIVLVWTVKYRGGFGWTGSPDLLFNWHPVLMTIGMVYLLANSILFFRAFINSIEKKERKIIHAGIHTVVLILAVIAMAFAIVHVNMLNYTNFSSLHSWLGIVTLILFLLQWLVGLVTFLYPGLAIPVRGAVLPHHVVFGLCSFILAITTCITGVFESAIFNIADYDSFPAEGILVNCIALLYVLYGVLVTYTFS